MHTFKKLLLVTSCISSVTLCTENQPLNAGPLAESAVEMSNGQIRHGFQILNRNFHDIEKALKTSNAQNEQFHKQMIAALHKATKTGWPRSARLITLGLASFITWEHWNTLKSAHKKATDAWDNREVILNDVKESALSGYLTMKAIMQRATSQTMQSQKPSTSPVEQGQNTTSTEQAVTPQAAAQVSPAPASLAPQEIPSTPVATQEASEFENPNNQRED